MVAGKEGREDGAAIVGRHMPRYSDRVRRETEEGRSRRRQERNGFKSKRRCSETGVKGCEPKPAY